MPLKREFLQDYERSETESINNFLKRSFEGNFTKTDIFPSAKCFKNLQQPIVYRGSTDTPIWPLIPFSGSTVIPLMPIEKNQFERFHGFKISEIENIVTFSEETGKIQFVLINKPTDYYKLDFLEPIFKRLRPPQFIGFQAEHFADKNTLDNFYDEFKLISNAGFRKYTKENNEFTSNKLAFKTLMNNLQGNYMTIRAISSPELSEEFSALFKSRDYDNGMKLLNLLNILVLRPIRNPLRPIDAYPLETLGSAKKFGKLSQINNKAIPFELGRLLMKKIMHYPESLEACKQIITRYEDEDIIELFQAVNEGIVKNNPDFLEKNLQDLSIALDDIWNNKTVLHRSEGIKVGVPIILGAIGTIAGNISGNYEGLLAALGFGTADTLFGFRDETISEKIAKHFSPSYQTIIYDFKKNHGIKN